MAWGAQIRNQRTRTNPQTWGAQIKPKRGEIVKKIEPGQLWTGTKKVTNRNTT